MSVISLSDFRPPANFQCPECGCEWFAARVVFDAEVDHVVGWSAVFRCVECGWVHGGPPEAGVG